MNSHDMFRDFLKQKEMIEKLSPKFNELTLDIQEILEHNKDPLFVSVLLFKLAEERGKTNKILDQINDKYDKMMFEFKTGQKQKEVEPPFYEILSETDNKILELVQKNGSATAEKVQEELKYKGRNGASQRLNKLHKEGHLKKVHSGQNVMYVIAQK